jgi:methylenetetrahydrofolate reductase (NADPH)
MSETTSALAHASLEIGTRDGDAIAELTAALPAGTDVHITMLPKTLPDDVVTLARRLVEAGFRPIPHIAARNIPSADTMDAFLHRLTGAAGVTRVFLVAGDRPASVGPFSCSLDVLTGEHLQAAGIEAVGFAGHPEGHPAVAMPLLEQALVAKVRWCADNGLASWVVSQFCFDVDPIAHWLRRLADLGIDVPVKVGLAGPAPAQKLLTYALRCGVGASLRALTRQGRRYGRLARYDGPEMLVGDVLARTSGDDVPAIAGFHVFPFGGVRQSCTWMAELQGGRAAHNA